MKKILAQCPYLLSAGPPIVSISSHRASNYISASSVVTLIFCLEQTLTPLIDSTRLVFVLFQTYFKAINFLPHDVLIKNGSLLTSMIPTFSVKSWWSYNIICGNSHIQWAHVLVISSSFPLLWNVHRGQIFCDEF